MELVEQFFLFSLFLFSLCTTFFVKKGKKDLMKTKWVSPGFSSAVYVFPFGEDFPFEVFSMLPKFFLCTRPQEQTLMGFVCSTTLVVLVLINLLLATWLSLFRQRKLRRVFLRLSFSPGSIRDILCSGTSDCCVKSLLISIDEDRNRWHYI